MALPSGGNGKLSKTLKDQHKSARLLRDCYVVLKQVRRHVGLRERIVDPDGGNVFEHDGAELVHRLRVDLHHPLQ